jgi:hypothetical protein
MYNINMYLAPQRFDLMAKYIYVKFQDKKINTNFHIELYKKHLETFNNCKEYINKFSFEEKIGSDKFIEKFNFLIENIKNNGYNEKYPIPMGKNNMIINGSHRLVICYYFNINPIIVNESINGTINYNYNFFTNRKKGFPKLKLNYSDSMALEYINHNKNLRAMVIYPRAHIYNSINKIYKLIEKYGYIYYIKKIDLTHIGLNNLIRELYRGEKWIGGLFPEGISNKTRKCLTFPMLPIIFILIELKDLDKLIELKKKCRDIFGIDKHSLHMTDYQYDTFRVSSTLLNKNSIYFLNNFKNVINKKTQNKFKDFFYVNKENKDDICIKSKIKNLDNIDYFNHIDPNNQDLIYNPKNHFYFNGFKFKNYNL